METRIKIQHFKTYHTYEVQWAGNKIEWKEEPEENTSINIYEHICSDHLDESM